MSPQKDVHRPEWDYEQLFHLPLNQTEKINLMDGPERSVIDVVPYGEMLERMREMLRAWRRQAR